MNIFNYSTVILKLFIGSISLFMPLKSNIISGKYLEGGIILQETKIKNSFTLVNAYSLTTSDKFRLQDKYHVEPRFFKYVNEEAQIPRFLNGDKPDQDLFIFDVPAHDKDYTSPLGVIIDDNTSIIIFTNNDTKYTIRIISTLLNEKDDPHYHAQDVILDAAHQIANFYLDKIKDVDEARVADKKLLRDKSKHRNAEYIDHLNHLRNVASGYVDSLADDCSLLKSVREILDKNLSHQQKITIRDDLIIYHQAKQEASFCFTRVRAVLRSFSMQVSMGNSRKLAVLTCVSFPISIFSMVTSFYGMNLGSQGIGLPFSESWLTASGVGIVFMLLASIFVYFFIFYKK